ncbi:Homeobox-ddt domain protein rlt2 [Thalictrum thalictroides]|uniref:Homeobox-ddt domain protein rlt2 n=1 Tax=Thalictrum thalictroides TaxID=46969 RepID=A0A7J6WQ78_THATH|nr:Homeobox-ddt domain protein rlt2 [Thalictrum thalictroides]
MKKQKKESNSSPVMVPVTGIGYDDLSMGNEGGGGSGSGSGSSPFEPRKVVARATAAVSRIGADMPMVKRYYEPVPQLSLEMRAIAFVEKQLGEHIRDDGPMLGMEFDPLPPGAFGAPIVITGQQKPAGRPYDGKMYERRESKAIKTSSLMPNVEHCYVPSSSGGKRKLTAGSVHVINPQTSLRAPHEYQFLPEQPSVRSEYGRGDPSHYYNSGTEVPSGRVSSYSTGPPYLHGKEPVADYGFQGQLPSGSHPQQGRAGHVFSSASGEYESPHRSPFANMGMESQVGSHPVVGIEDSFLPDRQLSQEEEASRVERKRKNDEARIAREVEAHEKRIRKELEKQDILRRKREEQMRKEMERQDRERRKEEERLMREKLREEERFQREQRRELERRERFLQKENLRAEKMRQKEELRKEKEAARLKAANERATARRIAKESMELIEDERLELMDLAVAQKGLPSILSLDSDTLQNLDLFRGSNEFLFLDMLSKFPPKSVQLKRPVTIRPWIDSEENIGNLLMVWKFLITFAEVLDIWPFTLDEFLQAMHDYEPRVLGEIHVALLRSIIKDIEDVARTPSIGLGANQNSAASPGGGHPQIVEGAYAWGFDIRCWQRHLNPVTWPEILRQFALSAGFGPQLKKRSPERAYYRDDNEGHDGEDIVSTLRNGAAAENALAVMQEKGFSQPRKSRHRLTPGTVKFAAFHVLSLEGSKGLTILEVADKIQKSGLRDLTTSKTPEASIAAALSRDGNLFERTAPSTYCVKSAFRKDPADAEAILSAAREKIQIFENGFSDSEGEKDAEDVNDVVKDEDSDCDVVEDADVSVAANLDETKASQSLGCSGNGENTPFFETPQNGVVNVGKHLSPFILEGTKEVNNTGSTFGQSIDNAVNCNNLSYHQQEDTEIDENNSGEPWVQGLTEGEYSDLSVEERLNALVALVGVAIEGNSIRVILEERLEAANALKKQMWAEAQLDKRRMKEDYVTKFQYPSYTGIKTDPSLISSAVDGNQSPYAGDNKINDASLNLTVKQEPVLDLHNAQNNLNSLPTERILVGQELSMGPESLAQSNAFAAEKSRAQLKSYIGHKAEEMYVYRSLPLGQDRRRNRYWQFVTTATKYDPGSSRIFFESQGGCWRLIDSEEGFDTLLASLDTRGIREAHLHSMLLNVEISFKEAVRRCKKSSSYVDPDRVMTTPNVSGVTLSPDCNAGIESPSSTLCGVSVDTQDQSSSFKIELGKTQDEIKNTLLRYQDYQNWMWREWFNPSIFCAMKFGKKRCTELLVTCELCCDSYFSEDNHCPVCHMTFGTFYNNSDFSDHVNLCEEKQKTGLINRCSNSSVPLRIRLLKSQLALIEACIPPEALQPLWTEDYRKSWGIKLQASSSAEELLQFLTVLEGAVKHDYLASNFETTKELLGSSMTHGFTVDNSYASLSGAVPVLPWVPLTTAAVALRLMELDASISYMLQQKVESQKNKDASEIIKLPSRYTVAKNVQESEQQGVLDQSNHLQEDNWINVGSGPNSSGRGLGIRGRGRSHNRGGRKLQRGGSGSRKDITGRVGRKIQTRGRGRRRGRRTVRNKQISGKRIVGKGMDLGPSGVNIVPKQNTIVLPPRTSTGMDWEREIRGVHVEEDDVSNTAEASESDDNGQASGDEYDDQGAGYGGMFHHKSEDYMESDEDGDEEGDEDDEVDGVGDGYEEGDGEDDGEMELDGTQMGSEYGEEDEDDLEGNEDDEDRTSSASSDYSQ